MTTNTKVIGIEVIWRLTCRKRIRIKYKVSLRAKILCRVTIIFSSLHGLLWTERLRQQKIALF